MTILGAARRGQGAAVVSALAVAFDLDAEQLIVVTTSPDVDLSRKLRAVWPSDRPLTALPGRLVWTAARSPS